VRAYHANRESTHVTFHVADYAETHAEVDQDVRSAPFASMQPGKLAYRRTLLAIARADPEGVAPALLPGQMREPNALEHLGMVLLAQHHRGFDLIYGEVPAAPDHVAVAPALEAGLRRDTAFGLARATRGLDLLKEIEAIALLPEPVDSLGRDVGSTTMPRRVSRAPTTTTRGSEAQTDDADRVQ
jgi:hypothetical protein